MAFFPIDRRDVVFGLSALGLAACQEEQGGDFYAGKTVRIAVGFEPGGSYDSVARSVARFLPKYIPGHPTVIVQNQPGAASMTAAKYVYDVGPQDGTYIAAVGVPPLWLPLVDPKMAILDPRKAQWMPSVGESTNTVFAWADTGIKTIEDAKHKELTLTGGGPYGRATLFITIMNDILGTKFRMIHGFTGSAEQFLAIERGEVGGNPGVNWSSVKVMRPQWLTEKKINILVQFGGSKPAPDLPGVPYGPDLFTNPEDKELFTLATSVLEVAHPYMMGTNVPKDRVEIMRKAFWDVFHDPEFVAEATKLQVDVEPAPAESVTAMIDRLYTAKPEIVARLRKYFADGGKTGG